ncbi:MAG TPA: hypothetical protein VKH40_09945 [Alloacidobacterium sp.]|nr:hypothetical protein [Alloacidobacterium sp.]
MRGLSPPQILEIWEQGIESTDIERGLLLLACCLPDHSWAQLAAVSIGRRNAFLFELRTATFGRKLSGFAVCPACAGQLEFDLNPDELGLTPPDNSLLSQFEHDGCSVTCRLPDSTDLFAASACGDVDEARRSIASRCIQWNGSREETDLPFAVIDAFETHLEQHDPAADISLQLQCPSCARAWEMALDIVSFFWREVQSAARHLVLEVDALARTYGWREADILGMSSGRRNLYLELVG